MRARRCVAAHAAVLQSGIASAPAAWAAVTSAVATLRAFELAVLQNGLLVLSATARLVHTLAYDPWDAEEALFIVLWWFALVPALRAIHNTINTVRRRSVPFDSSLLGVAATPLRQLGWAFTALYLFDNSLALAAHAGGAVIDRAASPLLAGTPSAIYLIWAGYASLHFQSAWSWFARQGSVKGGSAPTLQRVLALSTIVATAIIVSVAIGADPKALLGLGGLFGFASSLAVKDVLTNLVSGFSLMLHRPFAEGDEIVFGATNVFRVTAKVETLGYFQTVLRDAESQLIIVPNALLTNATLVNAGRRTHTRLTGEFALRVADAQRLEPLLSALRAELGKLPLVDERASPAQVTVGGFTPAGISISIQALFARGPLNRAELRSAAWLAVARVVHAQGCAFAAGGEPS